MKKLIKSVDIFPRDNKMFIQGQENYKNPVGGTISILAICVILSAVAYFLNDFFDRSKATIIVDQTMTDKVNVTNWPDYPILFRLSNPSSIPPEEPTKIYKILGSKWWTERDPTDPTKLTHQFGRYFPMEPCNKTKNLGKFAHLFENNTGIESFFCPNYPNDSEENIIGLYGDSKPFQYFHFWILTCSNNSMVLKYNATDPGDCYSEEYINKYLSDVYLDFRAIDYTIDSFSPVAGTPVITGQRWEISNTMYRRIWMYLRNVDYESDLGYIFSNIETQRFYQVDNYQMTVDVRNLTLEEVPGTFLAFTITDWTAKTTYYRKYQKAQQFLANVGGIVKGILLMGQVLTYFISEKLYFSHLLNNFPELIDKQTSISLSLNRNKSPSQQFQALIENEKNDFISKRSNISKTPHLDNPDSQLKILQSNNLYDPGKNLNNQKINNFMKQSTFNMIKDPNLKEYAKKRRNHTIQLSVLNTIAPFFICKNKSTQVYSIGKKKVTKIMDYCNIISKMYDIERMKDLLLDSDQNEVLKFLNSSQATFKNPSTYAEKAYADILNKVDKNEKDIKLMEMLYGIN